MTRLDLDPFEFGDAIAAEHLDRDYLAVMASYSLGYIRALHDAKKDLNNELDNDRRDR